MTLITILIVVVIIAVLHFILQYLQQRHNKKRTERMLRRFSELGTEYGLSFSGQEVLGNRIIGVDGLQSKLLFVEFNPELCSSVIDIDDIDSCGVKMIYGTVNTGNVIKNNAGQYLQAIVLELYLKKQGGTVSLPFYHFENNSLEEAENLERTARKWETFLSKLTNKELIRA